MMQFKAIIVVLGNLIETKALVSLMNIYNIILDYDELIRNLKLNVL